MKSVDKLIIYAIFYR